jgi:transposase
MSIIGAFDVHRRQLTFDYIDTDTGAWRRGRIVPADRAHLRAWLAGLRDDGGGNGGEFALEGCTGWRYVVEELRAAGFSPHLAEPADTAALRGKKRHAKTDKTDSAHLRAHLLAGDLPESWIPPDQVLEARAVARLYKDLLDERGAWHQRVAATLFHHGVPMIGSMATPAGRAALADIELSPAGWLAVNTGLRQIDRLTTELEPMRQRLCALSRRQPGCRALRAAHFGIGPVTSVAIWAEMGDVRRFSNSDDAVRHTGLDITVYSSDTKRSPGHLARQGPQLLRWALYEAAKCAARPASPDHAYYQGVRQRRRSAGLATLAVARNSPAAAITPCASSTNTPSTPRRSGRVEVIRGCVAAPTHP